MWWPGLKVASASLLKLSSNQSMLMEPARITLPQRSISSGRNRQIFRRALLRGHERQPERFHFLASRVARSCHPAPCSSWHDRLQASLSKEEAHSRPWPRRPAGLVHCGRKVCNDRHALRRHHGDGLDGAALDLLGPGLNRVAHIIDAPPTDPAWRGPRREEGCA